jgi:hypothetical protein
MDRGFTVLAYEKHTWLYILYITINNDNSAIQGIMPDYCTPI